MKTKPIKTANTDNLFFDDCDFEKKIGQTIYVVTSRSNGDKRRDMATALVRLMERDSAVIHG